jgi:hypothetical protein
MKLEELAGGNRPRIERGIQGCPPDALLVGSQRGVRTPPLSVREMTRTSAEERRHKDEVRRLRESASPAMGDVLP